MVSIGELASAYEACFEVAQQLWRDHNITPQDSYVRPKLLPNREIVLEVHISTAARPVLEQQYRGMKLVYATPCQST